MSQTVTQKQCTELKTSWVHQVHSLRAQVRQGRLHCAVSWRAVTSCRSLGPAVSWPGPAVSQRAPLRCARHPQLASPLRSRYTIVYHDTNPQSFKLHLSRYNQVYRDTPQPAKPALLSRYNQLYRDTTLAKPGLISCHDTNFVSWHTTPRLPLMAAMSRYNFHCIVTHSSSQTALPRPAVLQYNFPLYYDTVGQ